MRMRSFMAAPALAALLAAGIIGCGDGGLGAGDDDDYYWPSQDAGPSFYCFSSNECPTGWVCTEFGVCEPPPPAVNPDGGTTPLPPEVEREFGRPASTFRYVYVNMPEIDALAKIDGSTLAVTSVPVGDRPEVVATIPGTDSALALDRGSATATIVRPTVSNDERVTLHTLPHLNRLDVSPTGGHAVAWYDLTKAIVDAGGIAGVEEVGSFQDVTILSLERGAEVAVDLSVGFRPREVEFDDGGTRAFIVNDDGVSVVDLAAAVSGTAHVAPAVPLTADPLADSSALDVDITADGAWAIGREPGRPEIRVVGLQGAAEGSIWTVELPSEATDVDLLPSSERAIAVLRESATIAIIDIPGDAIDPTGLELIPLGTELVGSAAVNAAETRALLYTNASDVERVVVVDLTSPGYPWAVRLLEKGVRAAAFAPDGRNALVLHSKRPGDPSSTTDLDEFIDRSYGYSLLDLEGGFDKLVRTPVDPGAFAFVPDRSLAYLILDGGDAEDAVRQVQELDLETFVVTDIELGSSPEAVGVLPAVGMAFVSQRHGLGRVTFIDLDDRTTRTITGFELNSHIID